MKKKINLLILTGLIMVSAVSAQSPKIDGFEDGDLVNPDWNSYIESNGAATVVNHDSYQGSFALQMNNTGTSPDRYYLFNEDLSANELADNKTIWTYIKPGGENSEVALRLENGSADTTNTFAIVRTCGDNSVAFNTESISFDCQSGNSWSANNYYNFTAKVDETNNEVRFSMKYLNGTVIRESNAVPTTGEFNRVGVFVESTGSVETHYFDNIVYDYTGSEDAPTLSNFDPVDGATNVDDTDDGTGIDVDVSVTCEDPNDATLNWCALQWSNGTTFYNQSSVSNGSSITTQVENLGQGENYTYRAKAFDGSQETTSSDKTFTTAVNDLEEYYELPYDQLNTGSNSDIWAGSVVNPNYDVYVQSINIVPDLESGVTCRITDNGGGNVLEEQTGSGDNLSFSGDTKLTAGTNYNIICGGTHYFGNLTSSYPFSYKLIDFTDRIYNCNSDGTGCTAGMFLSDFSQWYGINVTTSTPPRGSVNTSLEAPKDGARLNEPIDFNFSYNSSTSIESAELYLNTSKISTGYSNPELLTSDSQQLGDPSSISHIDGTDECFVTYWKNDGAGYDSYIGNMSCPVVNGDRQPQPSTFNELGDYINETQSWEIGYDGPAVSDLYYNGTCLHSLYQVDGTDRSADSGWDIGINRNCGDLHNLSEWTKHPDNPIIPDSFGGTQGGGTGHVMDGTFLVWNNTPIVHYVSVNPNRGVEREVHMAFNKSKSGFWHDDWENSSTNPKISNNVGGVDFGTEAHDITWYNGNLWAPVTGNDNTSTKKTHVFKATSPYNDNYVLYKENYFNTTKEVGQGLTFFGNVAQWIFQDDSTGDLYYSNASMLEDWNSVETKSSGLTNSSQNNLSFDFIDWVLPETVKWSVWLNDGNGYKYETNENRSLTVYSEGASIPASISIFSPLNQTYNSSSVDLNVTASRDVNWTYNLDGDSNQSFTPNITLTGISDGVHTVNVYGNDSEGNISSASETFTIDTESVVQINSSVQINQTDNNAYINVTKEFNVSNLTVYGDATNFGGINWSISSDGPGRIDVNLDYFNDNNTDDTYLANYSVSDSVGNVITSSFQPRPVDSVFQVTKNGSFFKQIQSDANELADFGYEVVDTAYTSFTVRRTDQFRPEINSTTYRLDQVNGNERMEFVLWSRGANDIASSTGPGTRFEFTNTSMKFDVSLPLSGTYSVTDFPGLTRNRQVDVSKTDSGIAEDTGYSASLESQRRTQTLNITNGDVPSIEYVWNSSLGQDFTGTVNRSTTESNTATETGDFVENQSYGFNVAASEVVLGFNYTGIIPLEANNTVSNSWNNLDTTGAYSSPVQCSTTNNTAVNLSGNELKNFSVGQTCNPGSIGNPSQTIVNDSVADERIWYNSTDMVINSNETSDTNIVIRADKSNLKNADNRDANSLNAVVETVSADNSSELNVTDTGGFFRITVGDIQASSLYTDDSDWSVTYTLTGENTTTVIGGGGGGVTEPTTDDQTVYWGEAQTTDGLESFNVQFGSETVRNLTVTNTVERSLTAELTVPNQGICQYIRVRRTLDGEQWSKAGSYSLDSASLNNLGTMQPYKVDTQIRFNLPNRTELEDVGITDYSCEFETSSSYGVAEPLVVETGEGFSLTRFLDRNGLVQEFCFSNAGVSGNGSVESVGDEFCVVLPTPLTGFVIVFGGVFAVFGLRRGWF